MDETSREKYKLSREQYSKNPGTYLAVVQLTKQGGFFCAEADVPTRIREPGVFWTSLWLPQPGRVSREVRTSGGRGEPGVRQRNACSPGT